MNCLHVLENFRTIHTTLCIQFSDRENNDINNTLPLGKQICLTTVWGCVGILSIWRSQENILIFSWKSRTFFLAVRMTFKCNVSPSKFFLWSSAVKYYSRTGVKWSSINWISQRTLVLEEHKKCSMSKLQKRRESRASENGGKHSNWCFFLFYSASH